MSYNIAFEKLSNIAKTKREEIKQKKDEEQKRKEKIEEDKKKFRECFMNELDNIFPTYQDIEMTAEKGLNYYNVLTIEYLPFGSYYKYSVKCDIENNNNLVGFMINTSSCDITINEIYDYMKDKSIPELGNPKCNEPDFLKGLKVYYEW